MTFNNNELIFYVEAQLTEGNIMSDFRKRLIEQRKTQ